METVHISEIRKKLKEGYFVKFEGQTPKKQFYSEDKGKIYVTNYSTDGSEIKLEAPTEVPSWVFQIVLQKYTKVHVSRKLTEL